MALIDYQEAYNMLFGMCKNGCDPEKASKEGIEGYKMVLQLDKVMQEQGNAVPKESGIESQI